MARITNPFRASFGSSPPYLAGREEYIADFVDALHHGPGTHERISLITGFRGVGKTALLNALEDAARAESWWVLSETAIPGFMDRLTRAVEDLERRHFGDTQRHLTGVTMGPVGASWQQDRPAPREATLRQALTSLLEQQREVDERLAQDPVGILITLDELHHTNAAEVVEFGTTIQHLVREDQEIAVVMAGIPQAVRPLLASKEGRNPVTFLRRANRIDLGRINAEEARSALSKPLEDISCSWSPEGLELAVEHCGGYPFMVQLVGHRAFPRREGEVIEEPAVRAAIGYARRKLGQLVHEPALQDLSDFDRSFLLAMAVDDGPTRTATIAQRLHCTPQQASNYRARLIDAEMIEEAGYGLVDFAMPYMRDYLREHGTTQALTLRGEE